MGDSLFQHQEMTSKDGVSGNDSEKDNDEDPKRAEDEGPDEGAAFHHQQLLDGGEGGLSNALIVHDSQPFLGMGLFFWRKGHLIQFPLVLLDDSVELHREVGDEHMILELQPARGRDID